LSGFQFSKRIAALDPETMSGALNGLLDLIG
jgi:hypothetical protein